MIPGTAIPTTRLTIDDSVQSVKPTQAITDVLSEFKPGQRLVAEIQSQLPNGTYRALIAQRDVTLALPFAARAGDSLELEVVNTEGRLTFAVAGKSTETPALRESVTTTLSQTGQLIGTLLAKTADGKSGAPPAELNSGRALIAAPPTAGSAELAPQMQKAVSTSGVFYESHQAAWVEGKLPQATLLLEPQGRLPPTLPPRTQWTPPVAITPGPSSPNPTGSERTLATNISGSPGIAAKFTTSNVSAEGVISPNPPPSVAAGGNPVAGQSSIPSAAISDDSASEPHASSVHHFVSPGPQKEPTSSDAAANSPLPIRHATSPPPSATNPWASADITDATNLPATGPSSPFQTSTSQLPVAASLSPETAPIVQQQLNALATNVYAWHGVAWPGQNIEWEIVDEDAHRRENDGGEATPSWQTQIRLSLPSLGAVDAVLRLRGQNVDVALIARREDARQSLTAAGETLRQQYAAAGLELGAFGVSTERPAAK